MAGTPITANKETFFVEEGKFKVSVSEAVIQKILRTQQFHGDLQYDTKPFFLNGPYRQGLGDEGVDGIITFPFAFEIVGMFMYNFVPGVSGITELDLRWMSGSTVEVGSIFSTTPKIDFNVSSKAYMAKVVAAGQEASEPASSGGGITLPVFSKTTFDAFDAVFVKITDAMVGAENSGIGLWVRPRNS